jgi:formate dehydrogenase major subunit
VAGLAAAFGSGAMTNPIADIEKADVILLTGSNTTENHPVLSSYVKRAVTRKGAKLIVVDPRRVKITEFAHKWLRPNLGTDVAWINGLMQVIIAEKHYSEDYVGRRTTGFDDLKKTVEKYTPDKVERITGIPAQDLIVAARLYSGAQRGSILYCMGITQHTTGTDNVKSLANLAMLCGNVGIVGGGVNPLRGQNNVQGACDMGGLPDVYSGYQRVADPETRRRMCAAWGVDDLPDRPGLKVTQMVPAAHDGTLKAMYIIGENPLVSDPDLNHTQKSLSTLDFLVVQDIFLTETAQLADVVLPAVCFAEKEGTFSNTERRVLRVRKAVNPPGQARQDWQIICDLATRMGYPMSYENSEAVMEEIRRVTPSYAGITYSRINREGIPWPCPNIEHPGTPILHREQFTRGKGMFHAVDYVPPAEKVDADYPLYLTTGRLLYQYHTGTMTMRTEGLNEIAPDCHVEISPGDAKHYGISDHALVTIASRRGSIQAKAMVSPKAVTGTVFIPFHYAKAAANRLTHAALDPISGIPEFKVCAVKLLSKTA